MNPLLRLLDRLAQPGRGNRKSRRARRPAAKPALALQPLEDRTTPSAPPAPAGFTSTTTQFSNTTVLNIPDNPTVFSTITVTGVGTYLHDVDLTTFIQHTWTDDLDITLTSPAGTIVTISTDGDGSNDNVFNGTLWDDDADPGNEAPYASPLAASKLVTDTVYANNTVETDLVPEEPLGAFRGENPNGVWTITIDDDVGGDIGTLDQWRLDVTTLNGNVAELPVSKATNSTPQAISATGTPVVTSTVVIAGAPTYLQRVTLQTFLTHTNAGNLDITLRSPAGTIVTITTDNGGTLDDVFNGTLWDDDADPGNQVPYATPLGTSKMVGDTSYVNLVAKPRLTPEEALSAFIGENPNGTWTLVVSDDAAADGGSLNSWTLNTYGAAPFGTPTAAVGTAPPITVAGGTSYTFTVVYTDNTGINVSTLDSADIRVTGPAGYDQIASFVSFAPAGNGTPRTATYTVPAAGGTWNDPDNGTYDISVQAGEVADIGGLFVPGTPIGTFTVSIPASLLVTNTNDAGAGSLRAAVLASNATVGVPDAIIFGPLFNTPQTINLTTGQLTLSDSVVITGPGSGKLTVAGAPTAGATNRHFTIDGPGTLNVSVSGMTLTGANLTGAGGSVLITDENVTLTDVTISNNLASGRGGGVLTTGVGRLTLQGSTVTGNSANGGTGGGVNFDTNATLVARESTISGNVAAGSGGGVYFYFNGSMDMATTTVSGNISGGKGGGVYFYGAVGTGFGIVNSTLSGNKAANFGGGLFLGALTGTVTIRSSTIVDNNTDAATNGGGGINRASTTGVVTLTSTVVARNTSSAGKAPDVFLNGGNINASNSFFGSSEGLTITGTNNKGLGTNAAPADPQLGPLQSNGGPTLTHAPLAGSTLINNGSNPAPALATDQRSTSFVRAFGAADIGAVEVQPPSVLSITTTAPSPTNLASITFTVVFNQAVNNLSAANFGLTTTGTVTGTVGAVTGSGTTWTVVVDAIAGNGTLRLDLVSAAGVTPAPFTPFTGGQVVVVDRVGPQVQTITLLDANPIPTGVTTARFQVTFTEPVTGVAAGNFVAAVTNSVTGNNVISVTGSGTTWVVTLDRGTGNGNLAVRVNAAGAVTDAAGNALTGLPFTSAAYAVGLPVVNSINGPPATNQTSFNYTVVFNQPVTTVAAADFVLVQVAGTAAGTVGAPTGGGTTWTVPITGVSGAGSLRLDMTASGSGEVSELPFAGSVVVIDLVAPLVTSIVRAGPNPTNTATVSFTVTFDEPVVGVLAANFTLTAPGLTGAGITSVTGSGTTWTVNVNTGTGDGTVNVGLTSTAGITDLATNVLANTLAGPTYTIDRTPPTVQSIVRTAAARTNAASVNFTITFSEAVLNLTAANLSLTTAGVVGAAITNVSGAGTTWTVTAGTGTGDGTIRLNVANTTGATDTANNALAALPFTGGETYTIDKTPPRVQSIALVGPATTNAAAVDFTVTFTEPVTGVTAANFALVVTGELPAAAIAGVTGSGATYTVTVTTGTGLGTLRVDQVVPAGTADIATNALTGTFTTGAVVTVDTRPPFVVSSARVGPATTFANAVQFTVTFSEPVTGVTAGTFGVVATGGIAGAAVTGLTGSGTTYTVTVGTGTGDGTVRLALVAPGGVLDAGGNVVGTQAFPSDVITIDKTAPVLETITRVNASPTNAATVAFTVTFSEVVFGLTGANFTVNTSPEITGAALVGLTTADGRVYTATVATGSGSGGLALAFSSVFGVVDAGGLEVANPVPGPIYTIDKAVPTVTINQAEAQADPVGVFPIVFSVTFSEPVTGFGADDIILGGTAGTGVVAVTGSGSTYTVTVGGLTRSGSVALTVRGAAAVDAAGNVNLASTSSDGSVSFVRPPVANPESFTTTGLLPLTVGSAIGVLRNDTDPDGRPLTAVLVTPPTSGMGTVVLNTDGTFVFTPAPGFLGLATFRYAANNGEVSGEPTTVTVNVVERTPLYAVTAGPGGGPQVTIYNQDGSVRFQFFVYVPTFLGGVTVATADVTGDGVDDFITGAGAGGGPHVRVFDGLDARELGSFFAFSTDFFGGVSVAAGDMDGDGRAEVVVGAGPGAGPHVKYFTADGTNLGGFFAYGSSFTGGVNVAAGDVDGDRLADIVTAPGAGGAPHVRAFRGTDLFVLQNFFAFAFNERSGASVTVADAFDNGETDIIVGSGTNNNVRAFRGRTGVQVKGFEFPGDVKGVRVSAEDTNSDGRGDILLMASGPGGPPRITRIALETITVLDSLGGFPEDFLGGLYVG